MKNRQQVDLTIFIKVTQLPSVTTPSSGNAANDSTLILAVNDGAVVNSGVIRS